MSKKFNVYFLNQRYYDYLVRNNLNQFILKETRPYIGFVGIKINGVDYAIPLTSDPNNKYHPNKKYDIPIYNKDGKRLDILKINKMIPIINNNYFVKEINLNDSSPDFIIKMGEQLQYLNEPKVYDKVHELANEIYNIRVHATDEQLDNDLDLKYAVDFNKAENLMYEYAFDLFDKELLDQEPLLHSPFLLQNFSELNKYCLLNGITDDSRFIIYETDACNIELLKHRDGSLELVEEIWDSTEYKYGDEFIYYRRPFINVANGVCNKWSKDEINNIDANNLINQIYEILNDNYWLDDELNDELLDWLDNQNIFSRQNSNMNNQQ